MPNAFSYLRTCSILSCEMNERFRDEPGLLIAKRAESSINISISNLKGYWFISLAHLSRSEGGNCHGAPLFSILLNMMFSSEGESAFSMTRYCLI
jgi:hypothetical protein